jgi:hypothetical protein
MPAVLHIVPSRDTLSDRFPHLSFAIRVPAGQPFEVACASDPRLLLPAWRHLRAHGNFAASGKRQHGGETYVVPPEHLRAFAAARARRLYYALATADGVSVGRDYVRLGGDFTGRTLGAGAPPRYGSAAPLAWGGDAALATAQGDPDLAARCYLHKVTKVPTTYQAFEKDIMKWIATCVMSRTRNVHHEIPLVQGNRSLVDLYLRLTPGKPAKIVARYLWGESRVEAIEFSSADARAPVMETPQPPALSRSGLPAAIVIVASTDALDAPGGAWLQTLKKWDGLGVVSEKKKVDDVWWYRGTYSGTKEGWVRASHVTELADPNAFTYSTAGGGGSNSPFQAIRDAVSSEKLEKPIARNINYLNAVLLPEIDLSLPNVVAGAFYHALVAAKGNFKTASLIAAASYRALKPSSGSGGVHPWVQRDLPGQVFDIAYYRDKLWHFFWNAYEKFDGRGSAYLDMKGIGYELKSRKEPIASFFFRVPLDEDATEDVIFNRGGINFGEWITANTSAVIKDVYQQVEVELRAAIHDDAEMSKEPPDVIDRVVEVAMNSDDIQTEVKKRSYQIFADYAGAHIVVVLHVVDEHRKK